MRGIEKCAGLTPTVSDIQGRHLGQNGVHQVSAATDLVSNIEVPAAMVIGRLIVSWRISTDTAAQAGYGLAEETQYQRP